MFLIQQSEAPEHLINIVGAFILWVLELIN